MGIRRSVNPRLVVETLLLRWVMLDRIVDLEQVMAAGQPPGIPTRVDSGEGGKRRSGEIGQAAMVSREPLGSPAPSAPPMRVPAFPPTIEAVRAAWPAVVAAMRAQSRFLGEALAATQPASLEIPWLTVLMSEPNALFSDRLEEEASKVEEVLSRSLGGPVRLRVSSAEPGTAAPSRSRRMSESGLKAERLREFRSKDPALDTAVDALDLEIVD
jgi:DNA polymerase-3 subunit gamma/tau